jgi:modulator of FtsH protease
MEGWSEFYLAEVGAAAALAGLLVVAMSINIEKIMAAPTLPTRAAQPLVIVGSALALASLALFPGQSTALFGWEAVAAGAIVALSAIRTMWVTRHTNDGMIGILFTLVFAVLTALPPIVGGSLLIGGAQSGLYWIGAAIIVWFAATLLSGWALLVEILR